MNDTKLSRQWMIQKKPRQWMGWWQWMRQMNGMMAMNETNECDNECTKQG